MRHCAGAGHSSRVGRGCIKGTRRGVLRQLEDWLHDEQGERLLWLTGNAGDGKSAIAQTFAEMCFADGILGASFFCPRESDHILSLLPTIAFQLAHRYPRYREELLEVLREYPDIGQASLTMQVERLIVGPFEATQIQTLIIIDGMDEYERQGWRYPMFLSILSGHMNGIPNVKFLVTGRPVYHADYHTPSKLLMHPQTVHAEKLYLHQVERSLVDDDIKLFLRTRLGEYKGDPGDKVDYLCSRAGGSFAEASKLAHQVLTEEILQELDAFQRVLQETARLR